MHVVPFHDARHRLALLMDQVVTESTATLIVRNGGNAVLMSESAYNGLQETLYLFSSPKNAARLLEPWPWIARCRKPKGSPDSLAH